MEITNRPQRLGQVKRINKIIKETLTKLVLETGTRDRVQLLPLVLFRVQNTPSQLGLTPFGIQYGRPLPLASLRKPQDPSAHKPDLKGQLKALQIVQTQVWKPLDTAHQPRHREVSHPFQTVICPSEGSPDFQAKA